MRIASPPDDSTWWAVAWCATTLGGIALGELLNTAPTAILLARWGVPREIVGAALLLVWCLVTIGAMRHAPPDTRSADEKFEDDIW